MGFCESIAKLLLIIFNICFFLIGAAVLGVGIWVKVDKSNLFEMMRSIKLDETAASFDNTSSSLFDTIAIILIILGAITFITGFCGCCGAIKESQCLLFMYSLLVTVVIVGQIGVGIYAAIQKNKVQYHLETSLVDVLRKDFNGIISSNPSMFTKVLTAVMFEMKCCGIRSEKDFQTTTQNWRQIIQGQNQIHPIGCCQLKQSFKFDSNNKLNFTNLSEIMEDPSCPVKENTKLNYEGCISVLIDKIKSNLTIVIGICVGLGLFEILCIVFACCVARKDY